MADYTWPPTLPQKPLAAGFRESHGVLIARTPMDLGPAKLRRRGLRPATIDCVFKMTDTEVAALETFVTDTLFGVRRFNFTHPRTSATVEARIVPSEGGEHYTVTPIAGKVYQVALVLEVLP